jgi:hypothetical protein
MNYNIASQDASEYPDSPGYRRNAPETSKAAAEAVAAVAKNYRDRILDIFKQAYPEGKSSDQIAAVTGLTCWSVRPRVSELVAGGKLERTDDRVKNDQGRSVMVWRACA